MFSDKVYKKRPIVHGDLLIANPFLSDPNFKRSVVLICESNDTGAMGYVLNRLTNNQLSELEVFDTYVQAPLYLGGPVEQDTLHVLHQNKEMEDPGTEITKGLFWGCDFDELSELLHKGKADIADYRFFIGYSGWDFRQLKDEVNRKSWIPMKAKKEWVFHHEERDLWKDILMAEGGSFKVVADAPAHPNLN